MFARVLREYRFGFDDLLKLSLRRFWFLSNQVERLRAEEGLRQLQVIASAASPEGYKSAVEHLQEEIGQIYVWTPIVPSTIEVDTGDGLDPEFDREGLRALKAKYAALKSK